MSRDTLAWTPELSEGCEGCGFVFPDDEALVQAEFERVLPFAQSAANSARDPAHPKSALGLETKPFYVKSDDPYKEGDSGRQLHVRVLLRRPAAGRSAWRLRSLGKVTLKYRINDGRVRTGRDLRNGRAGRSTTRLASTTTRCAASCEVPILVTR